MTKSITEENISVLREIKNYETGENKKLWEKFLTK